MGRAPSLSLSAPLLLLSMLWSLALCPDFFQQRGHGLGPIPTAPTMSFGPTLGKVGICYPKEWEQVQEAMTPQKGPQVASLSCAESGGCPASPSAPQPQSLPPEDLEAFLPQPVSPLEMGSGGGRFCSSI